MTEYTDHKKAVILDELCAEMADAEWLEVWKSPTDDSWVMQIDSTFTLSAFTAQAVQDLMKSKGHDGQPGEP